MAFFNQSKENKQADSKEEFATFYGPLIPSVRKLKKAGHFISGLSEFTILYNLSESNLPIEIKWLLVTISIVLTLFAIYIIEHGLSKTYAIWIRQIIRWKFGNKWFGLMFFILTLIVIPLLLASPTLSGWGGGEFIENNFTSQERRSTDSIEIAHGDMMYSLDSLYTIDSLRVSSRFSKKETSIRNKYLAKIDIQERKESVNQMLVNNNHNWAKGHIADAKNKILLLKGDLSYELDTLENTKFREIQALDKARQEKIKIYETKRIEDLKLIKSEDDERIRKSKDKKENWSYALMILCGFSALIVVIAITVIEIYRAGSGQKLETYIDKNEPNLLSRTWSIFRQKSTGFLWRKLNIDNWFQMEKKSMQIQFQQQKKEGSETARAFETTKVSDVSVSETTELIKANKRKIKSYEWKLRNKVGKAETAHKNIARLKEEVKNLGGKI